MCSPERDIYLEDLVEGVEDVVGPLGVRGGVPVQARGQPQHRFAAKEPGDAELVQLLQEGAALAAHEGGAPVEAPFLPQVGDVDLAPPPLRAVEPPAPPPALHAPGGGSRWHALQPVSSCGDFCFYEEVGGFRSGDPVPGACQVLCLGDRALVQLPGGASALAYRSSAPPEVATPRAGDGDLRTLPVRYNRDGERDRDTKDATALLTETEMKDWPVSGPRTVLWLCREMAKQGMTPTRRHEWWRTILRLGPEDQYVGEHAALSRLLELGLSVDQLNLSELASFEAVARRYQLIEERYSKDLLAKESGGGKAEDLHYETTLFMGSDRAKGSALVSPKLEEWISSKLRDEAAIMKERRKGREERQLARSSEKPSDSQGSNKKK